MSDLLKWMTPDERLALNSPCTVDKAEFARVWIEAVERIARDHPDPEVRAYVQSLFKQP